VHLNSYDDRVKQQGMLNPEYLRAMLENRNVGLGPLPREPEYGSRQPEVTRAVMEAWNWLEQEGFLIRASQAGWFTMSRKAEELLGRKARFEHLEKLGLDRVKRDLLNGGYRVVGGTYEQQEEAWEWVRMKEGQATLPTGRGVGTNGLPLIADERLSELRQLTSSDFDFRKLVRLCEELNSAYNNGCFYATAMLTRGLLFGAHENLPSSARRKLPTPRTGLGRSKHHHPRRRRVQLFAGVYEQARYHPRRQARVVVGSLKRGVTGR